MAKITAITAQTKNKKRCNLFVDGEFFVGVSLETVLKERLKVGQEVDQRDLAEIISSSDKVEAIEKAVTYCSKTLKTKKQVKTYLLGKGYTEDIVWHCIDKLIEYNLINDKEYAKRYLETTSKNQGKRLAEYKLMAKGLKKEEISIVYDDLEIPSKENAKEIALKYMRNKDNTKENIAKTYRYLISRGFSYEDATYAVSAFKNGDDD